MSLDPATVAVAAFGVCAVTNAGILVFLRGASRRNPREQAREDAEQARLLGGLRRSDLHPAIANRTGANRT